MKTRILHTKIYSDSFFTELSPLEKLLFIYYLTNENVNIIGCYECPDRKASFDTGIDTPKIRVFQEKAERAGKIFFKDGFVFLKNAGKYENYTGTRNDTAKDTLIKQLSIPVREWFDRCSIGVSIPPINHKSEIINHKEGIVKGKQILDDVDFQQELREEFPRKDVELEIKKMKDWLSANGKKKDDYRAFARNWLRNEKFSGGRPVLEEVIIRPPTEVQT